jgi:acyl-homoserine lactone acylase PvdQ
VTSSASHCCWVSSPSKRLRDRFHLGHLYAKGSTHFQRTETPLEKSVVIRWNEQQVRFIEASIDADLATALGLVHARLRLGQMAMVRHLVVLDLADPDANFFILAGGQDGWLGSSTYADQLDLWRGAYVQLPLRLERFALAFRTV